MKDYGLVSIITPSYNCSKYVGETIEAIQAQTYQNWEMLITDDFSKDESCAVIEAYAAKDSRVKLLRMEKNGGAGAARNNSIKAAQGRYIAFCDSDDVWLPEKLEKQLALMEEKKAGLVYDAYYECNEDLERKGTLSVKNKLTFSSEKHVNQIGTLTAMYDTEVVGKVYMPLIRKSQDWALWLKVLKICKVAYATNEPLADYRIRPNSNSSNKMKMIRFHAAVYEDVFGYPHWFAMLYTLFINIPTHMLKRRKVTGLPEGVPVKGAVK